jgi:hypothetical protein
MSGRPKITRTPEELKELQKQRRKKYKGYIKTYRKLYYLKKILEDPDYNKKNNQKRKEKTKQ